MNAKNEQISKRPIKSKYTRDLLIKIRKREIFSFREGSDAPIEI